MPIKPNMYERRRTLRPVKVIKAQGPKKQAMLAVRLPKGLIEEVLADKRLSPVKPQLKTWMDFVGVMLEHYAVRDIDGVQFKKIIAGRIERIAPQLQKLGITPREAKGFLDGFMDHSMMIIDDFRAGHLTKLQTEKQLSHLMSTAIRGLGTMVELPKGR